MDDIADVLTQCLRDLHLIRSLNSKYQASCNEKVKYELEMRGSTIFGAAQSSFAYSRGKVPGAKRARY